MSGNVNTEQFYRIIRVLDRSHDPRIRVAALKRLYRHYVRISRLPLSPESLDIFRDMGEKLVDVLQDELEMNHEYCRAIQVLRHDIRQ
ncbi:hypothetical protein DAPPUDRAFT_278394, partial [Daphnia pulex]